MSFIALAGVDTQRTEIGAVVEEVVSRVVLKTVTSAPGDTAVLGVNFFFVIVDHEADGCWEYQIAGDGRDKAVQVGLNGFLILIDGLSQMGDERHKS